VCLFEQGYVKKTEGEAEEKEGKGALGFARNSEAERLCQPDDEGVPG